MNEPQDPDRRSYLGVGTGIALGLVFGGAVGMLVFDNLALGGGIGLIAGVVLGSLVDSRRNGSEPE